MIIKAADVREKFRIFKYQDHVAVVRILIDRTLVNDWRRSEEKNSHVKYEINHLIPFR